MTRSVECSWRSVEGEQLVGQFYTSRKRTNQQLFLGLKSKDVEYNKCVLSDETRAVMSRLHTAWEQQELIFLEITIYAMRIVNQFCHCSNFKSLMSPAVTIEETYFL